jgi:hypothetical protein
MTTANRRASATIAFFIPRCLAIFIAQRPIAEIRQSNDRADQQENHDSWNFQSARQPWSSLKLLRRPTGEKNQPIYGASVSCVTDDFVVCRQAERVKVFFLPLTPAGFFLAGFFMSRLSSPWSKVRCRLVRRKIETLD